MKISVVTVVKNGERFLRDCLLSVLSQDAEVHLEYIVVDGGSVDHSLNIIQETEELVEEGAVGRNLNSVDFQSHFIHDNSMYEGLAFGMLKATGDAIMYLNSDDILHARALDHIADVFERNDYVQWVTGYPNQIDEKGKMFYKKLPWTYQTDFIRQGIYGRRLPFIQQESCFWRRSLMDCVNWDEFKKYQLAGDQYLWMRFAQKTSLYILPEFIGGHRTHGNQLSHLQRKAYFREYSEIIQKHSGKKSISLPALFIEWCKWLIPDKLKVKLNKSYL